MPLRFCNRRRSHVTPMGQGQCNALPAPVSFRWGRGCVTQGASSGSPVFGAGQRVCTEGILLPPPGRETAEKLLPPAPVTAQPISHPSLSPGAGGLMVRPTGIPDCGRRHTSTSAILRIWQEEEYRRGLRPVAPIRLSGSPGRLPEAGRDGNGLGPVPAGFLTGGQAAAVTCALASASCTAGDLAKYARACSSVASPSGW